MRHINVFILNFATLGSLSFSRDEHETSQKQTLPWTFNYCDWILIFDWRYNCRLHHLEVTNSIASIVFSFRRTTTKTKSNKNDTLNLIIGWFCRLSSSEDTKQNKSRVKKLTKAIGSRCQSLSADSDSGNAYHNALLEGHVFNKID